VVDFSHRAAGSTQWDEEIAALPRIRAATFGANAGIACGSHGSSSGAAIGG